MITILRCIILLGLVFLGGHIYGQEVNYQDSVEIYFAKSDLKTALIFAKKNAEIRRMKFGERHIEYASAVEDIAVLNNFLGLYQDAEKTYLQLLEIRQAGQGKETKEYIESLNSYATLCWTMGKYQQAEFLYKENLGLSNKVFGNNDSIKVIILANLANNYGSMGRINDAINLSLQVVEIYKRRGLENINYAAILNNLGMDYGRLGNLKEAENCYLTALKIIKKDSLQTRRIYQVVLNNLGDYYQKICNYKEAEMYFTQALEIVKKLYGDQHADYAFPLGNLAELYSQMGNYGTAELLQIQATSIRRNSLGADHPLYAISINSLAKLYQQKGNFIEADSLYKLALEIRKKKFGEVHLECANSYNNLGSLNDITGHYDQAEQYHNQALNIRRNILGETHPDYALTLNNLGKHYFQTGNTSLADSFYAKAILIYKQSLGEESTDFLRILNNRISLHIFTNTPQLIDDLFAVGMRNEKQLLTANLDFLSENQLLAYLQERSSSFDLPFSTLWHYNSSQLICVAYNSRLLTKGIALENAYSLTQQMEQSKDSLLAGIWKYYKSNKLLLNKLLSQPIAQRTLNTDSLSATTNQQEKELLRRSAGYRNMKEKLNITWQDVRSHLKTGEAAIEFVRFNYLKRTIWEPDTIYYAAMLLRPQDTVPVFIKLFEEKELQSAFKSFPYRSQQSGTTSNPVSKAGIYKILWQPLELYLSAINTIYFSPDGLLHGVAFAAIPYKTGLLCDKYKLVQLASTRQVTINSEKEPVPQQMVLFGGINYNRQNRDTTAVAPDDYRYVYQQNRSADIDSFKYLPGTLKEIQSITKSMERQQKKIAVFTGENATEAAFRNIAASGPSPQVIHFSTHGFTLPDEVKPSANANTFKVSDNPLLRSGLVMAGGNKGWKGKSNPYEDDGILTALEISAVPLQHTQLAVLSACQSGTGKLMGSEGIFGLQRAFKLAGVNYVMASLWKVPDVETAEFMSYFYQYLSGGSSIRQSFSITQQAMRKKHSPYYWAAFTLVQ